MRRFRAFVLRLLATFSRSTSDRDFADELDSHLQHHIDDNIRAGMTPDEARRSALVTLGGVAQTRERYRERQRLAAIDTLRQDLVYATRVLTKHPGFAVTAIVTLALGIGATTAIFSVINAVLLRPLPFAGPARLMMVYAIGTGANGNRQDVVSYPTFADWRARSRSFSAAAAYANASVTVDAGGEIDLVQAKRVTPSFFAVLGVQPTLGRVFRDDDVATGARVVILSDGFWRRRFGAAADVVGKTVRLTDDLYTIVGVMPPAFHFDPPDREQLYAPLPIDPNRQHGFLRVVARLRDGVTRAAANAELDAICAQLTRIYPRNESTAADVVPLVDALAGPSRLALLTLFGVVTLLLLIACANVAGLLLARGAARQREIAVRAALGAGRARLVRQLLTENLLVALAGGAAGLLLADWLARLLAATVGAVFAVPRLDAVRTDGFVLAFAICASFATGILFGILPAWSVSAADLNQSLRDANRTSSSGRAPRARRGLVVAETALALILLAGAGVLMRTLLTMRATSPGFDTRNVLAIDLWLPPARFTRVEQRASFIDATLARVRALPGVRAAAVVADLPLNGSTDSQSFHIVGRPDPAPGRLFNSGFNITTAGYFALMRIPIRRGREFTDRDGASAPRVIVVNEVAATRFWPDRSPLGQQIELPIARGRSVRLTVVGVAGNVRHIGLADPPRAEIYLAAPQAELTWPSLVLAVRTAGDPFAIAEPVKAALRDVDPNVPVVRVNSVDEIVARSIAAPRLYSALFAAFAGLAVALAAIGLYGLVSYSVAERSREIGVRMALGASRRQVMRMVLDDGLRLSAIGAALGVAGGLAATRVLVGLMNGVQPNDPLTFVAVTAVLIAAALLASYLPARRAARVDPMTALRSE
jgi:putative ABC transport system permease protein